MSPLTEKKEHKEKGLWRLLAVKLFFFVFLLLIIFKLFHLQILSADYWRTLAENQHSLKEILIPRRGRILVRDHADLNEYPVATVTQSAFIFADPRKVTDPVKLGLDLAQILEFPDVEEFNTLKLIETFSAASNLTQVLELQKTVLVKRNISLPAEDSEVNQIFENELAERPNSVSVLIKRLSKKDDVWEPVAREVSEKKLELILGLQSPALDYFLEDTRAYPEADFSGQLIGFLGKDEAGQTKGFYGIEGYFNDFLAGKSGELFAETDSGGSWIGVGQRKFTPAVDGGDIILTIDRTLQVTACAMLEAGVQRFKADSGSLVILEPSTGKVLAMCGEPDFAPKEYGSVEDFSIYNNSTIFTPYEPGSIMKPLVMAAALDVGAVTPNTPFLDTGSVVVDDFTIRNSGDKVYGPVSMIQVLEDSINTGMVWVMRRMGRDVLADYLAAYGFGALTGIELKTEAPGTISSLAEKAEVYAATASFGQGITVTPLQIAAAFSALANGGAYMKPYIVDELRYADGTVDKIEPQMVRQVISPKTATTIGAMLVSVVEYGHGKRAGVPGYYIAGKTGTAQISKNGLYSETEFNGSFAGYGPVHDPKFAMVVKIENPKEVIYAESTAAPVFGEIASFILRYYGIAPDRGSE